jgi:hypothetical protein
MDTGTNITRSELRTALPRRRRPTSGFRPNQLPQALFVAELLTRGLPHVAQDNFRGACTDRGLHEVGVPVLVRADREFNELEALVRLKTGELALVDAGHGQVRVEVAGDSRERTKIAAATLREAFAVEPPVADRISLAFWMRGEYGGNVRHREIDAPSFEEIAGNYATRVREALERLTAARSPDRGRLILWRGEPGTGKSHALRALARAWAPWCSAHFIMDPQELLGMGGSYLLDLLSWDSDDDDDRWRLLILEDAGELIAADARAVAGQALSRLLNVADGLLGQGTRTLLLITTNEPLGRLHPATRRAGRCLADIEFTPLSIEEANAWLAARGRSDRVRQPTALADLFGRADGESVQVQQVASGFGFARAFDGGCQ